jgi:hypothetical protein
MQAAQRDSAVPTSTRSVLATERCWSGAARVEAEPCGDVRAPDPASGTACIRGGAESRARSARAPAPAVPARSSGSRTSGPDLGADSKSIRSCFAASPRSSAFHANPAASPPRAARGCFLAVADRRGGMSQIRTRTCSAVSSSRSPRALARAPLRGPSGPAERALLLARLPAPIRARACCALLHDCCSVSLPAARGVQANERRGRFRPRGPGSSPHASRFSTMKRRSSTSGAILGAALRAT